MALLASSVTALTFISSRLRADTGTCGGVTTTLPFNDVMSSPFFCQIARSVFLRPYERHFSHYLQPVEYCDAGPDGAAFITRTQDSGLRRGSKRAALRQFWTTNPRYLSASGGLGTTTVGTGPDAVESDGGDLWVANVSANTVSRVRGTDGKLLDTWTGATSAAGVLVAMGRVFVTGEGSNLYMIDPTRPGGAVTEITGTRLGGFPQGIAFDGSRIWVANAAPPPSGSVSIVTPGMTIPWSVSNVFTGFRSPIGILFDGSNIWVTDLAANTLLKLDPSGAILQTVNVGVGPRLPSFDGTNIWVPNINDNTVTVVRAATGAVIATLTGNGLASPWQAAFDGQRILVANHGGDSVSLWKASDLTPIGTFSTGAGTHPLGACSDGTYFWITLQGANQVARF
jgi:YVTN family beta-propeller protein